jgi:hypothetical protein
MHVMAIDVALKALRASKRYPAASGRDTSESALRHAAHKD